ncbi:TniQ family protein [Granulicella sp. S190]|uniref:TniQ family protein n=1 Tax=Granulicella sp. S190 TaxID=1747226 RepID=UPI00131E5419|nr:TniQ family protein [Granulicella sp. S190]
MRHPIPRPTSSLLGYILKISQANGFSSPWSVIRRAGLKQHEFRGTGIKLGKIAAITACPIDDLIALGYSDPNSERSCHLLDHKLLPTDLDLQSPRICPECVRSLGFIEAQWDLAYMVGCPVHLCWATSSCVDCGEALRWFRQGQLRCHCGAKIKSAGESISLPESDLLQVLRTKVLRLLPLANFGTGLPFRELQQMELRSLLRVITVIGSCSNLLKSPSTRNSPPAAILSAAAETLSGWPSNFFELLRQLGRRRTQNPCDIRDQFAPLYSSLFKEKLTGSAEELDFIRIAFLDFVSNHWDGRKVDSRLLSSVRSQVSTQYVSRAQLARSLRVDPRTIKRHVDLHCLPVKKSQSPERFDKSQFSFIDRSAKLLRVREAARDIGISVAVLRSLTDGGEFEVRHQLPRQPGFHEYDVRSFKDKVLALVLGEMSCTTDLRVITVGESLQRVCQATGEKANLLRDLLAKRIRVIGQTERTLRGLLISSKDLSIFIKGERRNEFGRVMTCAIAAKTLNCEIDTVRGLIEQKLLCARKTARGWEIAESSVEEFSRLFVRLSWVAALVGTSSRRLMALCACNKLELCEIKSSRGGVQPFVRRQMVDTIVEYVKTNA